MPRPSRTKQRGNCNCGRDHDQQDHDAWRASYQEYISLFYHPDTMDDVENFDEDTDAAIEMTYAEHTERLAEWANKLDLT